ncbi:MAG: aminotransferase class I/II-fold pyridoxal phosphate-dependent enzyme [Bdellovibrio bacteriovorus]
MSDPGSVATRLATRARSIAPFHVMRLLARARALEAAGRPVQHLEIGEPDFATPAPVVAAAQRALEAGHTHYTPAAGLPRLREAIAGYYRWRLGLGVDPARILVTPGASGALQLALLALLDPGDRVLIADPSYPCYRQVARLAGGEPLAVPVGPESGYRLTRDSAERAWVPGVRALLVASPSNPTGAVLSGEDLAGLHDLCRERGAALIVDEIYQGLVYGVEGLSALTLGEAGLFVVNSCSKYFGMTGWRVGWVVAPRDAVDTLERIAQNLFIAAGTLAQHAACAAFDPATHAILEGRRQIFEQRRDLLLAGVRDLGFGVEAEPQGAFYLYAGLPERVRMDSMTYASRLLDEAGVAVTPGADFGDHGAERHLRFAYTRDAVEIAAALDRISAWHRGLGTG